MSECVKVIVRCRPMNEREKGLKCACVIGIDSERGTCTIKNPADPKAPPKNFTFDGAYFTESTTESIYNEIAYPLVEGVTEGYNGTIFAYGQTGCGKSFTMQGITDPPTQRGIIPRAFDHIFETVSVSETMKFLIHASYLEIYNEEIRDLLGKDVKTKLELHEHPEKGVYVSGLSMHPVHNVGECERVMEKGWKNRAVGATLMNADSSRSHSIFTISMEMITNDENGQEHIRAGKLNLVDLAGSERQAKTGATGDRLKEATKINLSLSALGNVISALVDGKSKHIPYRDSKLTRLLQDSLGGNTKTLMVACLSPADNNYDETLSTLRYANRAKNIKNKPKINEDPKDALLRQYQEEIERLKAMLMGQIPVADLSAEAPKSPTKTQRADLEEEKEQIRREYEQRMEEMQKQFEEEKTNKAKLEDDMAKLRNYYDSRLKSVDGRIADLPPTAAEDEEEQGAQGSGDGTPGAAAAVAAGAVAVATAATAGAVVAAEGGEAPAGVVVGPDGELAAPRDRPPSVMGREALPRGPGLAAWVFAVNKETSPVQQGKLGGDALTEQHLMQLANMGLEGAAGQEHLKVQHEELLHRLQELQQQMVGGENVSNKEVKERRSKRKKAMEDRRRKLQEANKKMDDDGIMVGIYDSIAEELKGKNKELEKEREVSEGLRREIIDLQSEFEFDRIDYLDTIRSQDKTIKYLEALVERMHPCLRRDCNYSNLDKIKAESKWDEENRKWLLPKMTIERTGLPVSGTIMPGIRGNDKVKPSMNGDIDIDDERLREKLSRSEETVAVNYLKPKRTQQLLNSTQRERDLGRHSDYPSEPMREPYAMGMSNGYHHQPADEEPSKELRAAQVHGQLFSEPTGRPVRLQALPSLSPMNKKSKKKRDSPF